MPPLFIPRCTFIIITMKTSIGTLTRSAPAIIPQAGQNFEGGWCGSFIRVERGGAVETLIAPESLPAGSLARQEAMYTYESGIQPNRVVRIIFRAVRRLHSNRIESKPTYQQMKLPKFLAATVAALTLSAGGLYAQTTVTTTTSEGTLSEFGSDSLVIRSETATEPLRYSVSKSTTYVDETGAPISVDTIRSERLPVTVHYVKEGDRMVANRVVVRKKKTTTVAPTVEERKTTTTTTKKVEKD